MVKLVVDQHYATRGQPSAYAASSAECLVISSGETSSNVLYPGCEELPTFERWELVD